MTAVLGVLNKHAVAIAADSAVTMTRSNGRKISNTANKIFKLSQFHPVGVAVYGSAEFMQTPWEIVVGTYRQNTKDQSYDLLNGYVDGFLDYVKTKFSPSQDEEIAFINGMIENMWSSMEQMSMKENGGLNEKSVESFVSIIDKKINEIIANISTRPRLEEYNDYTKEEFLKTFADLFHKYYENEIQSKRALLASKLCEEKWTELIVTLCYTILITDNTVTNSSGLVFVGYGENEIFPHMISIAVYPSLAKRLRYHMQGEERVTKDADAIICPFAQHDVIDTLMSGIEPSLERSYEQITLQALFKIQSSIAAIIAPANPVLANQIKLNNPMPILNEIRKANEAVKNQHYIYPLLKTVGAFSKEELADMAESMIALTSLKRKMTFDEETVGGPVDVAVISKVDGFIWIHRKHYFNPDINVDYRMNKLSSYVQK